MVVIETERLLLRPMGPGDAAEMVALHGHPDVARFVGALDPADAAEALGAVQREWAQRGHGRMAIVERATGRFVGRSGLRHWAQFGETELGWTLRHDAWGNGYATEAARAVLEWGFANLPLPYITAMIQADNERSLRVAQRLGFAPLRDDVLLDTPVVVHAVSRPPGA